MGHLSILPLGFNDFLGHFTSRTLGLYPVDIPPGEQLHRQKLKRSRDFMRAGPWVLCIHNEIALNCLGKLLKIVVSWDLFYEIIMLYWI